MSETPRLVAYPTPAAFVEALLPFDNWHLNITLGPTVQLLENSPSPEQKPKGVWLTVWTGDQLDLVLARPSPQVVALGSAMHSSSLAPPWLEPRMALVADELHRLVRAGETADLVAVVGPQPFAKAFVDRWAHIAGKSPDPKPRMDTRSTHLPRSRLPDTSVPAVLPTGHDIHVISPSDISAIQQVEALTEGMIAYIGRTIVPGVARKATEDAARQGALQVYTVAGEDGKEEVAGYVKTGRVTRRTASIQNVFTLERYRRQGIAEKMARAAVLHLFSAPHPFREELKPLTNEEIGIDDVILFSENSNPSAQAIYKRVGFGIDGRWEEGDGTSMELYYEMVYDH